MREKVILICTECLSRNYSTTLKKEDFKKFQINKFCRHCGKMTVHKITK